MQRIMSHARRLCLDFTQDLVCAFRVTLAYLRNALPEQLSVQVYEFCLMGGYWEKRQDP